MRFHAEHRFHGTIGDVVAAITDPAFYLALRLPDLAQPEVLGVVDEGHDTEIRLRYTFVGQLDPVARRLLGNRQLGWLQEVRIDRLTGAGRLAFAAEDQPKRLHGEATFALVDPEDGDGDGDGDGVTVRRLDGELVVSVPLIGAAAERSIVPGVLGRLDIEAQALDEHIQR